MATKQRPDIVIIMADEPRDDIVRHQYRHHAFLPNIDRLRENGVTFENPFCQIENAYMVRTRNWKLVYHTDEKSELYNLETDPGEHTNLFGKPESLDVERRLLMKMMDVLGKHRRTGFNRGRNSFFG